MAAWLSGRGSKLRELTSARQSRSVRGSVAEAGNVPKYMPAFVAALEASAIGAVGREAAIALPRAFRA